MNSTARHITQKAPLLALAGALAAFSSCSQLFEHKIDMDNSSSIGSIADMLTPEVEVTDLSAPVQINTSQGMYSTEIVVSWRAVEGASSYRLERAVVTAKNADGSWAIPDESEFEALREYYYSTSFTDTILTNAQDSSKEYGYRYYYRVMAENLRKGLESDYSQVAEPVLVRDEHNNLVMDEATGQYKTSEPTSWNESKDAPPESCGWIFAPPANVQAQKGKSTSSITITWNAVADAQTYQVYRSTQQDFSGAERINTSTIYGNETSYTDNVTNSALQGEELFYKVYAVTSLGNLSAASGVAMGYTLKEGAPACPENVTVENGRGTSINEIEIHWTPVEPSGDEIITYSLYRTSSADSVFTLVKKDLRQDETKFKDTNGLKTGLKYYYYVQCTATKAEEKLKGAFSETGPESKTPAMGFLLSPPSTLEVSDGTSADNVKLVWSLPVGSDEGVQFKYNVYSSDTDPYGYSPLAQGISGTDNGSGTLSAIVDKKNFYRISTVNISGTGDRESAMSEAAAPMPAAPANVTASKTAKPDPAAKANGNNVYPVYITWEAPKTDSPAGYHVYRSTKPDSAFRKLTEVPIKGLSYTDVNDTARAGTMYYYKVISLNSLNQGKNGNDPATDKSGSSRGYGAITPDQWFREYNKTVKHSQEKLTLMHNPDDMKKLGSETAKGDISGTLSYTAKIEGLGARILMPYNNYADFYIGNDPALGVYFRLVEGSTNTTSNMSANGNMDGTVKCVGMYPGEAVYDNLQIKGGAAGGGYYAVTTRDQAGNVIFATQQVNWLVGEE